ncbi:MAG: hypothetical protein AAGJ52_09240 [Pseudomonadota bacterium]
MIILLVPELEALLSEVERPPSTLSKLLARSQRRSLNPNTHLAELVTGQAIGSAAIARRADRPGDAEGIWIHADPIHLRPDLNAVWTQSSRFDSLDQSLVAELQSLFDDAGMAFDLTAPDRGYLRIDTLPSAGFKPPWELQGQSLDHVLPSGEDAARWIGLLTECQIVLHQHRSAEQQNPSGLWFWGPGQLPVDRPSARVSHLIGVSPILSGLAEWLSLSHSPEETGTGDNALRLWQPDYQLSAEQSLQQLDELIVPLWRRLKRGNTDALELASREVVHRLERLDAWRFWKRH